MALRKLFFNWQLHYLSPKLPIRTFEEEKKKKRKKSQKNKDKARDQAQKQKFGKQVLFHRLGLMFSEYEKFSNFKCKFNTLFPPSSTQNEVDLALMHLSFFKSTKKILKPITLNSQ